MRCFFLLALVVMPAAADLAVQRDASSAASAALANPIRKVVTMLQAMQKKVTEEGEKEKELYEKFMCYCKTGASELSAAISDGNTKMPQLDSQIKEAQSQKAQDEESLKQAQVDRSSAKAAIAEATALREKEAAAYAAVKTEYDTNIAALSKAIKAIESGMAGAFLQTNTANVLKQIAMGNKDMIDEDRQMLLSFLSGGSDSDYAPQSGEITGILKTLNDEFKKTLAESTEEENAAVKSFEELVAAKNKEIASLTEQIETKTVRIGELGVSIVQMQNDLTDTEAALIENKKFIDGLSKSCETKTGEWEERQKLRGEELMALADTIKVLNDDDALDLFKKTLPGTGSSSFVQVEASQRKVKDKALALLQQGLKGDSPHRAQMDLISLALHGKKIGFEKVIKMIDDLVVTLKTEQLDDEHKKEYCSTQFDMAEDKQKELSKAVEDAETAIENAKEGIATLKDEIAKLEEGIKDLDKSVLEATENRKEESADYQELMASDSAAKELLNFAKNRLNKFYNPKLYKAPPKQELTEQERLAVNMGGTPPPTEAPGGIAGTGVTVFAQISKHTQAVPEKPATWEGGYGKKGEESTGVIAMIDLLIKDLDKEMTEAEAEEKNGQKDYEAMMADSAKKRAQDSKSLTEKGVAKAELESDLESHKESVESLGKELMATGSYIKSLHAECDWLLQYFDMRKQARTSEIESLQNAKAVLSGADYASLLQTRAAGNLLRRSA